MNNILKTTIKTLCLTAFGVSSSQAQIYLVPKTTLSSPAVDPTTIVNFSELVTGTAINGKTIKGFTFSENTLNPTAVIDTGPGNTTDITVPNLVSSGTFSPATYVLTINMPTVETAFGFGFAILNTTPTSNALSITLFNGNQNLGALTFPGSPDPTFDGGFAGIGSTIGFTSAQITFGSTAVEYAMDNVAAIAVPEPTFLALAGLSGLSLLLFRRFKK